MVTGFGPMGKLELPSAAAFPTTGRSITLDVRLKEPEGSSKKSAKLFFNGAGEGI